MTHIEKKRIRIEIAGEDLPLYVAAHAEALMGDPADPDQVPCWAEPWPASLGLAAYFIEGPDLAGKTVLELGAGVGLPGLICGLRGAAVTFSDFQPRALSLCEANARLHRLTRYHLLLADWRNFPCHEKYDLVLASDIAYEPRLLPSLKSVLQGAPGSGGSIYFSHPCRPVTFSFVEALLASGYYSEERCHVPVMVRDDPVRTSYDVIIQRLRRKEKPVMVENSSAGRCLKN